MCIYIKYLIFLVATSLCFTACNKKPLSDTIVPGKAYSYYSHPDLPNTDGFFLYQTFNLSNDSTIKNAAGLSGIFYNVGTMVYGVGGSANIAGYNVVPSSNQLYRLGYDSLYGKVINYSITPPVNEGTGTLTGSFYSPAPIYFTNILPVTSVDIPPNSTFPVTWNTDANNTNGVNISAQYWPTRFGNYALAAKGDSVYLENNIMVSDNGSNPVPSSFFSKFPTGAILQIFIGRGSTVNVQNGQYTYSISGFFSSSFMASKK